MKDLDLITFTVCLLIIAAILLTFQYMMGGFE